MLIGCVVQYDLRQDTLKGLFVHLIFVQPGSVPGSQLEFADLLAHHRLLTQTAQCAF
jgi:hypothetical protein